MTTTILKVTNASARQAARSALREAGIQVVEIDSWEQAAQAVAEGGAELVVCDAAAFEALRSETSGLPHDAARKLSHDLRTPLSAMAGWLHLLESGKLDEAGRRRALEKLNANIEDQVRTIERVLGPSRQEEPRK